MRTGMVAVFVAALGMLLSSKAASAAQPIPSTQPAARCVVLLLDVYGVLDKFDEVRFTLVEMIQALDERQSFNIIIHEPSVRVLNKRGSVPADRKNKDRVTDFLGGLSVHGQGNFLAALDLAFSQKPDVIYLIGDGDFNLTTEEISAFVRKKNPNGKVILHGLLYLDDAKRESGRTSIEFKKLVEENGGKVKVVVVEPQK